MRFRLELAVLVVFDYFAHNPESPTVIKSAANKMFVETETQKLSSTKFVLFKKVLSRRIKHKVDKRDGGRKKKMVKKFDKRGKKD